MFTITGKVMVVVMNMAILFCQVSRNQVQKDLGQPLGYNLWDTIQIIISLLQVETTL